MKIRKKIKSGTTFFLQLFVAIFFIASAIVVLADYGSAGDKIINGMNKLFGQSSALTTVIAIVELIVGIILFMELFIPLPSKAVFIAILAILVLWGINIIMIYIVNDLLKPNFFVWLKEISLQLIVFAGLLGIIKD